MKRICETLLALAPLVLLGCGPDDPSSSSSGTTSSGGSSGTVDPFEATIRATAIDGVSGDFTVNGQTACTGASTCDKDVDRPATYQVGLNVPGRIFQQKDVPVRTDGQVIETTWDPAGSDWCMAPNAQYKAERSGRISEITTTIDTSLVCRIWGLGIDGAAVTAGTFFLRDESNPDEIIEFSGWISEDLAQIYWERRSNGELRSQDTLNLLPD